jgi:hypothetical protein
MKKLIAFSLLAAAPLTAADVPPRLQPVEVLATSVDMVDAVTVMARRGETVTRVNYTVRSRNIEDFTLRLPDGAELWDARVAGSAVKPSKSADGRFHLSVDRVGAGDDAPFAVDLVFFHRRPPLGLFGRRDMTLPMPDAPVSRAHWAVHLPTERKMLGFSGDVDPQEAPAIQTPAYPVAPGMSAGMSGSVREKMEIFFRGQEEQARHAALRINVLPVGFQVPLEGTLYHFGRALIVGESPRLVVTYGTTAVSWGAMFLAALVLTGILLTQKDRISVLLRKG